MALFLEVFSAASPLLESMLVNENTDETYKKSRLYIHIDDYFASQSLLVLFLPGIKWL